MKLATVVLSVLTALTVLVESPEAITVVVPDDYPTLQAVMNVQSENGIHRVYVRPGVVEDSLYGVISGYFTVIGLGDSLTRPAFGPTEVYSNYPLTFENVTFTGLVFTTDADFVFRECHLRAGLSSPMDGDPRSIRMDRCRVTGLVDVGLDAYVVIDSCWFDEGRVRCDENELWLTNSTFTGSGPAITTTWEERGEIRGNTIRVSGVGLDVSISRQSIEGNVIEDCAIGVRIADGTIAGNVIRRCGVGIVGTDAAQILGNEVIDSGSDGIQFDRFVGYGGLIERNVVLRSGRHGIVLTKLLDPVTSTIRGNTSAGNGGSGLVLDLYSGGDEVSLNIGYGNGAHGLASIGAADPVLSCNDWFANDSSAVSGMAPGGSDLFVDPQFCDVESDDVSLFASSPLVNSMHCGLVGARGVGCDAAAAPLPVLEPPLVLAPVTPNPSVGAVRIRWSLPREERVHVTILDVTGRVIATVARGVHRPGLHDVEWPGSAAPSGVYFVRLRSGETNVTRSFLVRR